jgi:His/Glu/Gln/Arg/opine family amino acid ABC transporter permease subunit
LTRLWEVLNRSFPEFAAAFWVSVQLIAISFVIATVAGILVAALRVSPLRPLRWIGGIYVEALRNVPLLVLLILGYAGLRRAGFDIQRWPAATACLGLYTGAYIAEAVRSGVFAVGKGQIDAALSIGLTYRQALTKVVLPQAIRTVIPPIGNIVIAMIKNSAVIGISLLAITDLLKVGRNIQNATGRTNETFFWVAVGYLLLTIPATIIVKRLERRLAVRR